MKINHQLLMLLSCIWMATACKKTETIEAPAAETDRILSFKVTNVPDEALYGAINEEDHTITLILPYYYFLTSLQPEITLSEGATVSPASGTLVDEVTRKLTTGTTVPYTVTAKDGSKATYQLKLVSQQPDIVLDELSPDAANPMVLYHSVPDQFLFNFYTITGKNFIPQQEVLGIFSTISYLNDKGEVVYSVQNGDNYTTQIGTSVPAANVLPEGQYWVKVTSYTRSATMKNPIKVQSL